MVDVVSSGQGPSQGQQSTAVVAQQEVRARNVQTQPREAPPADSQDARQRTLQAREDAQRRQNQLAAQRRQEQAEQSEQAEIRRGQLLDVTA